MGIFFHFCFAWIRGHYSSVLYHTVLCNFYVKDHFCIVLEAMPHAQKRRDRRKEAASHCHAKQQRIEQQQQQQQQKDYSSRATTINDHMGDTENGGGRGGGVMRGMSPMLSKEGQEGGHYTSLPYAHLEKRRPSCKRQRARILLFHEPPTAVRKKIPRPCCATVGGPFAQLLHMQYKIKHARSVRVQDEPWHP
jgi:hypothetical protein